jgi:hypothetical protein
LTAFVDCANPPVAKAPAPKPAPAPATPRAKPKPWDRFDEARGWPPVNATPFVSRGHGSGTYTISVHVSPDARDRYASLLPGTTIPEGSVIAAFHQDADSGRAGPVYVMERRADGWSFRALDAEGRAVEQSLELCQRCHAEAPADSLFGTPKGRSKPLAE